jgi:hypothetical protein
MVYVLAGPQHRNPLERLLVTPGPAAGAVRQVHGAADANLQLGASDEGRLSARGGGGDRRAADVMLVILNGIAIFIRQRFSEEHPVVALIPHVRTSLSDVSAAGRALSPGRRARQSAPSTRDQDRSAASELLLRQPAGAVQDISLADSRAGGHGADRPVGLRQEHVPADAQPHERHHRGHPVDGRSVLLDGQDIYARTSTWSRCASGSGMVFQKSTPFPKSIFDNVAYGPRIAGGAGQGALAEIVEKSLSGPRCGTR